MEYKGYVIESDGTFGMSVIKSPGRGGQIPDMFRGSYTKVREAKMAIDQYILFKQEIENRPPPIKKVKLFPREVKNDAAGEGRD